MSDNLAPSDVGVSESTVRSWIDAAYRASSAALDVLRTWLTGNDAEARKQARAFDEDLHALRCRLQQCSRVLRRLPEGAGKEALRKQMREPLQAYIEGAVGAYGSLQAARDHYSAIPCVDAEGVGVAVVALPAAAWYAASAAIATAAIAYAVTYRDQVHRDLGLAEVTLRRAAEFERCLKAGGTQESCLSLLTTTAAPPDTGLAAQVRQIGQGAGAAGSGVAWGLIGLAALLAAAVVLPGMVKQ